MQVVPVSVGVVSRAWDEQHLELEAASSEIAAVDLSGFTPAVSGAAARFRTEWTRTTAALGRTCETEADALRAVIADYLRTDTAAALTSWTLTGYLREVR